VLVYTDEGQDTRYSRDIIRAAAGEVKQVLIIRPGTPPHCFVTQRRGQIKYRLVVEGEARRLGQAGKRLEVARWTNNQIEKMIALSSRKDALAIGLTDFSMRHYPMRLPHLCRAELLLSYLDKTVAQQAEKNMREILGKVGYTWTLEKLSERPPMKEKRRNQQIFKKLSEVAGKWEIPLEKKFSLWPSTAGLVPDSVGVVCGIGPVSQDLYTPQESIKRLSLLQRTLLLSQFLLAESQNNVGSINKQTLTRRQ
jgi:hypothetical protein